MPTKKSKKVVKKTAKKSVRSVKRSSAPVSRSEHDEFFATNPSIKPLIIVFMLIAAAAFIWIVQTNGYAN